MRLCWQHRYEPAEVPALTPGLAAFWLLLKGLLQIAVSSSLVKVFLSFRSWCR